MSEIKLRADDCRAQADVVRTARQDAFDIMGALRTQMDSLCDSFTGRTHSAFIARLDEWKATNDELLEALQSLGDFLTSAANTIEETDNQLAAQLG